MDIKEIKKNAKERMKDFCILCPECNGRWCAGKVPGMGGAMDLVVGAKHVIVAMEHTSNGAVKILKECKLPLTAVGVVDLIITEKAVFEVTDKGLVLKEITPYSSLEDIKANTAADFIVADNLKK